MTGGTLCAAVDPDRARTCPGRNARGSSPHFARWETDRESGRHAIALRWNRACTPARVTAKRPVRLSGAKALALRVFTPPGSRGARLDVSLIDASGRKAKLGRVTLDGLPGSGLTASYWAREVRLPLTAAGRAGLDLGSVKSLELTSRSASGRAWLVDAWGRRPGHRRAGPGGGQHPVRRRRVVRHPGQGGPRRGRRLYRGRDHRARRRSGAHGDRHARRWRGDRGAPAEVAAVAVGGGGRGHGLPVPGRAGHRPELSTKDVPAGWLRDTADEKPDPERALSEPAGLSLWAVVPAGRTGVDLIVPTVADRVREATESVRFRLVDPRTGEPRAGGPELTGSVLDAP
ncbi:hypothetical protein [Streptomyces sp. E-15]